MPFKAIHLALSVALNILALSIAVKVYQGTVCYIFYDVIFKE